MHSAVLLAADGDAAALTELRRHAERSEDRVFRDVVAPLCTGLGSRSSRSAGTPPPRR